jgi:ParB family chromosome partitioning protein
MADIYVDPDFNSRRYITLESVMELAESIRLNGLRFPIVVQPWAGPQPYRLVAGHRRFRAMGILKATSIPAMIVEMTTDFEALKWNLLENLERKDLTILEEAQAIRRLYPHGTMREIAEGLSRSHRWVYIRLQLVGLPEQVQQMAAAGMLTYGDIEALHQHPGIPAVKTQVAERVVASRREHKQRRPRVKGLKYTEPTKARSMSAINKMVARLLTAGITGLAHRMGAWCAGEISDAALEPDIQAELANQKARKLPIRGVF